MAITYVYIFTHTYILYSFLAVNDVNPYCDIYSWNIWNVPEETDHPGVGQRCSRKGQAEHHQTSEAGSETPEIGTYDLL